MNSPSDRQAALDYHQYPVPGKISVVASKPLVNQRDLALAYSPGWRRPVKIVADPANVFRYGARQSGGRDHQRHGGAGPGQYRARWRPSR